MKMIYVGCLSKEPDRDSGWIREFSTLGWEVISYSTMIDLDGPTFLKKIKGRFHIGVEYKMLQENLLNMASKEKPEWIHFRLPIEFDRRTILKLKAQKIIVTQYFNDDPFSIRGPIGLHWKFRLALTAYDAHFVYRAHNIKGYKKSGASFVEHCPPTYDPKRHFISGIRSKNNDFLADAAFIGHWENDWRLECLDALVYHGYSVILKGGNWNLAIRDHEIENIAPILPAFGHEYNYIYSNVTAGLCFFSKINNDSWTERALEIIAVGGLLVCERTEEAQCHFKDRQEAYFFSSIDELIMIIQELKTDPLKREKVRAAGYRRLLTSSDTIHDRAQQVYNYIFNEFFK